MCVRQWALITPNSFIPSAWVERFVDLIPRDLPHAKRVLDYACGSGRHLELLSKKGFPSLGVDRDQNAIATFQASLIPNLLAPIELRIQDLEQAEFAIAQGEQFAGIVVTNYLHRPHLAQLLTRLAPRGVLIYETFSEGNQVYGSPLNPDFLLRDNELITWVMAAKDFRIIAFEHLQIEVPKTAIVQRICAVRLSESATIPL
jgi:SAM-dependent methyltransferase